MKNMKKLSALLMVTVLAATSIVGCGGNNSKTNNTKTNDTKTNDTKTNDNKTEDNKTEDNKDNAQTSDETITATIKVWGPSEDQSADYGSWLQTTCEKFNEEYPNWDISFEYDVCPEGDAGTMVSQDPTASADVYFFANDQLTKLVSANGISKLGGETAEYVQSTNSPKIVDSVTVDGSIYGVPFTSNTWFMYYNKSVFSEEDIKSLDTMVSKAKISFPITNSWYLPAFFLGNGGTMYGDGTDEAAGVNFGGENGLAVTNYLIDLMANSNFADDRDGSGIAGIRDGSIAAIFSGSWDYSNVKEALGDDFGVAQPPTFTINGEEKQITSFAGSKAIGVNPNCQYPQIAVALAKYLASPEAQKSHYELRSVIPCNTEVLSEDVFKNDEVVLTQDNTVNNTSFNQPFVAKMSDFWTPTENFGKSIKNGEVTHDNAEQKTEDYNNSLNSSIVE